MTRKRFIKLFMQFWQFDRNIANEEADRIRKEYGCYKCGWEENNIFYKMCNSSNLGKQTAKSIGKMSKEYHKLNDILNNLATESIMNIFKEGSNEKLSKINR